jgi:uncharacterized tellurite resistance protein B-like protein
MTFPEEPAMPTIREMMPKILSDGKIDPQEVDALSELIYADGTIDREEADFLVVLNRRIERVSPAFERFYFAALKRHVLTHGVIDAEKTDWLKRVICSDSRANSRERRLLRELRGEAVRVCPEFEELCRVYC